MTKNKDFNKPDRFIGVPCEISDILEETEPGVFKLKTGASYQICELQGNTCISSGSPLIVNGSYCDDYAVFRGIPQSALLVHKAHYVITFPGGLGLQDRTPYIALSTLVRKLGEDDPQVKACKAALRQEEACTGSGALEYSCSDKRAVQIAHPCVLVISKDEIGAEGEISRIAPRPFQLSPGKYLSEIVDGKPKF